MRWRALWLILGVACGGAPAAPVERPPAFPPLAPATSLSIPFVAATAEELADASRGLSFDRLHVARTLVTPLSLPRDVRTSGSHVFGWGWQHVPPGSTDPGGAALVDLDPSGVLPPVFVRYGGAPFLPFRPSTSDPMADGHFVLRDGATLVLLDPIGGVIRWRADMGWTDDGVDRPSYFRSGDLLVGCGGPDRLCFALSWADGTRVWERPAPPGIRGIRSIGGDFFVLSSPGAGATMTVGRFDASTGEERWSRSDSGARMTYHEGLHATQDAIVVSDATGFHSIDVTDGSPLSVIELAPLEVATYAPSPIVDDGVAFAVVTRPSDDAPRPESVLVAIDLRRGALLWSSHTFRTHRGPPAWLVADADSVVACFDDEMLVAFDRTTGASLGRLGLGGLCLATPLPVDGLGRRAFVARRADELVVIERSETPPPALSVLRLSGTVTLAGAPAADVDVWAGDVSTRTDATGRYALSIATRGALWLHAQLGAAGSGVLVADVVLEVSRDEDRVVDLALGQPPPDEGTPARD